VDGSADHPLAAADSPAEGLVVGAEEPGNLVKDRITTYIKQESVLIIAWILALLSMIYVHPSVSYLHYLDYKVLGCLLSLMIVVAAFSRIKLFNTLAYAMLKRVKTNRQVALVLISITFFISMFVTNDVALITFVPFTIIVFTLVGDKKPILPIVVLQTVAANVGSSLTPMGNPQNLYIYSHFNMSGTQFFFTMLPLVMVGAVALLLFLLIVPKGESTLALQLDKPEIPSVTKIVWYVALFAIALLAVFNVMPWYVSTIIVIVLSRKDVLKEIDYSLLLTFVGFFIFVGNLARIESVREFLEWLLEGRVFLTSVLASQVISNVPATLLLSNFTEDAAQLLLGVNAGGCGTLIASLASVISFKFFSRHESHATFTYLLVFTMVNVVMVLLFIGVWALFLH